MVALTACSRQQPSPPAAAGVTPAPAHATAAPADAAGKVLVGPVLETMDASSYTYVRVQGDTGDMWAAAPQFRVKVGDRVRVPLEMPMTNFHSSALKRDFPLLYFVTRLRRPMARRTGAWAERRPQRPPTRTASLRSAQTPTVTTPMPAPAGGLTIAQPLVGRTSFAGKPVTVHGVVVEVQPGHSRRELDPRAGRHRQGRRRQQ